MSTSFSTPSTTTARRQLPALVPAVALLMLVDIVGGLIAIGADVNSVGDAWGGAALLAAPLPFMLGQVALTVAGCRWQDRRGVAAAGVLAAASGVSVASGFFDGGIGNESLTRALQSYQVFLLLVTALVGVLAARHARQLWTAARTR